MKAKLRAVGPDDTVVPKVPLTLDEAIESGDHMEILKAQRRDIASAVKSEKGPALAALHRQLASLTEQIEALKALGADDDESRLADTPDAAWGTG